MPCRTDDPVKDQIRDDARKEAELEKMPKCSYCKQHIQDDYLFDIKGELYCEECTADLFREFTENYIKE